MNTKFTEGPWAASAPDGSYHDVIRIFAEADPDGAAPVAICPQRQSAIMSVFAGQTDSTTEAAHNARLIAAAPDLLEAIEQAAEWASQELRWANASDLSIWLEREEHLRAVISKAIGK